MPSSPLLSSPSAPEASAHTYRDVDQLDPEGITDQVVRQHGRALQACVRPVGPVRVGNVQLGDGDGVDLVGRLGDGALDRQLVLVGQDRRHGGGAGAAAGAGALTMSRGVGGRAWFRDVVAPARRGGGECGCGCSGCSTDAGTLYALCSMRRPRQHTHECNAPG